MVPPPALSVAPPALGPALAALLALAVAAVGVVLLVRLARRRENELRTLAALAQAIAGAPDDPAEVAEAAYVHTARLVPSEFFQLGIFQGESYRTLIWVRDGNRVHNREFTLDTEHEGLIGWIRRTGEDLLVRDFARQADLPARPSYASEDPPSSGLFLPMKVDNAVIGILAVQSRRRGAFGRRDRLLLRALAGSVATCLAAIGWRGEARDHERQIALLEQVTRLLTPLRPMGEVIQEAARLVADHLEAGAVAVVELDGAEPEVLASTAPSATRLIGEPDTLSFLRRAAGDGQVLVRPRGGGAHATWECAAPLRVQDRVLGVLYINRRSRALLTADRRLIDLVASQLALAIHEAANYAQQQEEAWFTTVLLEVARHASQPGDLHGSLEAVLELTTLLAGSQWALLLTADGSGRVLAPGPSAGLRRHVVERLEGKTYDPGDFGLEPLEADEGLRLVSLPEELEAATGSSDALASLLTDGRRLLGVLLVEGAGVETRRQSLLAGIAQQISLRLENAVLVEEAAARRSLERELETARAIQESFLPKSPPEHPGWQIGAYWKAARSVGGDLYDFIPLPHGAGGPRWGLVIADVSDKGVPAALYMALTRALLRTIAPEEPSPADVLARVNRWLFDETTANMFVSAWYGVWEPESGSLIYANAGHNPPLLFLPQARARPLGRAQTVLGVLPDVPYQDSTVELSPGSLLVLYTDGVSEASDGEDFFGVHRIESTILALDAWEPSAVLETLAGRVHEFTGRPDPADDLTLVCLHRRSAPEPRPRRGG